MRRGAATARERRHGGLLARLAEGWRSVAALEISWRVRVTVAVLLFGGSSLLFAGPLGRLLASGPQSLGQVTENFRKPRVSNPDWMRVSGFIRCAEGWCLPPGGSGRFVYRPGLKTDGVREILVNLWFHLPSGGANRLQISVDEERSFRTIWENVHAVGRGVRLTYLNDPQLFTLLLEASNPSLNKVVVLEAFVISYLSGAPITRPSVGQFLLGFLCLGAAGVVLCRRWWLALPSLLILTAGATLRYSNLVPSALNLLEPDAQGYRHYAHQMSLFGETGFFSAHFSEREPMFILVVHGAYKLIGASDYHLRLVSFILSIVVIWVGVRIGRSMFGDGVGWMTGLLIAMNRPLIFESQRGLRLELEMIVLLVYLFCAFIWRTPKGILKALLMGGIGGILVLTRSTYLPALMPLQALANYEEQRPRREWLRNAAVSIVIMIALVVPHRYSMYQIHGDAFWDTTMYARWNANMEFVGTPGFPTPEQLSIDAYGGPRITYWQYMFGMHTVGEIVSGTARGYFKLFRKMQECVDGEGWMEWPCVAVNGSIQILGLAGLIVACFGRTYVWLPLAFMLVEFPAAFLYDRHLVERYRHTFVGFPLLLLGIAVGVRSGIDMARTYAGSGRQGTSRIRGERQAR